MNETVLDDEGLESKAAPGFLDKMVFLFGALSILTFTYTAYRFYSFLYEGSPDASTIEILFFLSVILWPPLGLFCSYILAKKYLKTRLYRIGYVLSLATLILVIVSILAMTYDDWVNGRL